MHINLHLMVSVKMNQFNHAKEPDQTDVDLSHRMHQYFEDL